jgi:hypothetical protein
MKDSHLEPACDVPGKWFREFLGRIGMSPEVAEWRYFDSAFNRERNRGFVWLRHDRIEGMIGFTRRPCRDVGL